VFDWEAFLVAAERLLQASPTEEAIQRIAIGRAYFALFNLAKARLVSEGVSVPATAWAHEAVWQAYQAAPRGSRRTIAQTGFRLRRLRDLSDYEASYPTVAQDAVMALQRARRAVAVLNGLAAV
jgi:uncharacterized protein (UPF0332 family)